MKSHAIRQFVKYLHIILGIVAIGLLAGCPDDTPVDPMDDEEWTEAFDPSSNWLLSVAGQSPDAIYAAGGTPQRGALWHDDGSGWSSVEVGDVPLLNWVHTFDDGTVVIAGNGGTILRGSGESWTIEETPTDEDLWGIWGASPDDLWAVGGRGSSTSEATLLRWDGTSWNAIEVDLVRPGVNAFFKVWGTGPNDVWIVGQNGVLLHWDGAQLEESGVSTSRDLISIWGTGPDDVYVVGGRGNGVIARWDGEAWTMEDLSPAPGLNGVWAGERGVWVAGARGTLREVVVDEEGAISVPREPPVTALDLHAVFGVPGGRIITVGGNFQQPQGPHEGVALEENR